ncbi:hypothetical protein [Agaribacter flavus]|uniref:Uncharacterized protein n=1 Tax=Agaribacter flavus TaxID=1902781 RepID=A0ABV7FL93_9ALTE
MKRALVIVFAVFLAIALSLIGYVKIKSKALPTGESGPVADALANDMLQAINHEAWLKTGAIRWHFAGRQQHLWDKSRHLARVKWDKLEVVINLSTREGVVYRDGQIIDEDKEKYLEQAWAHWANDSFWLNPVSKVFDQGTSRQFIPMEEGLRGLLVSYDSGGVTPGDSYLWVVGENALPVRFEMWVSIIPIKGLAATWDNWTTLSTGVKVAQDHDLGFLEVGLTEINAAFTLEELEGETDPFGVLF